VSKGQWLPAPLAVLVSLVLHAPLSKNPLQEEGAVTGTEVVGRDKELAAVVALLDSTGALPGVVLLEGEAGIGKTTLWRAGVEAARELSYVVLRASPAEKEATFSYSVVSDLGRFESPPGFRSRTFLRTLRHMSAFGAGGTCLNLER
jgi:MoxR-like ATPase